MSVSRPDKSQHTRSFLLTSLVAVAGMSTLVGCDSSGGTQEVPPVQDASVYEAEEERMQEMETAGSGGV